MSFSVSVGWGFAHIVSMSVGWLSAYQTCDIVTASSQFNLSDEWWATSTFSLDNYCAKLILGKETPNKSKNSCII